MKIQYCLPIIKKTKEEILSQISENPDYDFYEIWLSYIEDLDTDFVWKISDQYNGKSIFLFRKQNLEKSNLEQELKEKIIKLIETSDNFLDLDINDQKEELDFIKSEKLNNKLIVSYHNYKQSLRDKSLKQSLPAEAGKETLDDVIRKMEKYNPEIYKVSTFCKTPEDSLKLLTFLLKLKSEQKKFIILGMGENGLIARIFGTLWGNEMTFAPVDDHEKSAPGQLTKDKMEKILEILI